MSREIDERIVAMYFDNKNFESGAQQTLKTLDQLKQSCNMEGVGKGFEALGNISKTLKLDKVSEGVGKVRSSLQTVGNVVKKAFSLTPIDNFYHALMNFKSKYFDRVIGFDVAQKLASSLENVFRSLTIAPVTAGWNQYENTMDSVKTIMSSTGESIDTVKGKLQEMTDYANLTIYSLNDMTSNLGKFTNNGVKLDDATNAMIGLANATADAGQGATQASMAMYNVSQAIGVGKMTTIDWKSLENANIATQRLKNTFIQAAVASGDLEQKVVKVKDATTGLEKEETQYWTKAAKGSKAEQVTAENFRETLQKGWLTKEAMLKTFAIYSGQMSVDAIAAMGFSKQQAEEMAEIGENALKAAQEVRTFSKMMDALKESTQSTWAQSFEFIFGDMQEGTNLWTRLNDKIDAVLTKGADARNDILMSWRGMMKDENGQVRKIKDIYDYRKQMLDRDYQSGYIDTGTYAARLQELEKSLGNPELWKDYRDVAVDAFMDLLDTFISVGGEVKAAWTDVFGSFSGDTLKGLTQGFRNGVDAIREWLGSAEDANSRISKLRKGLTGVFNVIKIGVNIIRSVIEVGWSVVKPFVDPLLNLFAKFGEWMNLTEANNLGDIIKQLGDKFKGLWNTLANLGWEGAFEKIGDWFVGIWTKIKGGISEWLSSNGLEGIAAWFEGVRASIEEGANNVKTWWNSPDNGIRTFFSGIYESVTGWFKTGVDEEGNETVSPIVSFFQNIWTGIQGAYDELSKWWENSGIPEFFERMWNEVTSWFTPTTIVGKQGNTWVEDSPIVTFFKSIWTGIQGAFDELTKWWEGSGIPEFFERMWNEVTSWFTPTTIVGKQGNTWTEDSPIVSFFKGIVDSVQSAFDSVVEWWENSGIPEFFERMWNEVTSWFTPTTIVGKQGNTWVEDSPIVAFFKSIWTGIQDAYDELVKWWGESGIPEFFERMWNEVTSWFTPTTIVGKQGNTWTEDSPIVGFFNGIWEGIQGAWEEVKKVWQEVSEWKGWAEIGKFFSDTWNWITEQLTGSGKSPNGEAVGESMGAISEAVTQAVEPIESVNVSEGDAETISTKVGIIDKIFSTITGLIESAKGWITDSGTGEVAIRFFNTISMIIEAMAVVIEQLAMLVNHAVTGKLTGEEWAKIIGIIGSLLAFKIFEYRENANLAKIADNATGIGETMLQIAGAIALVSAAVAILGRMDVGTLAKGIGAVAVVMIALGVLVSRMSKLQANKALAANAPTTSWERILGKLISAVGMIAAMKVLLDGLPTVLDALSNAKKLGGLNGDDIMKTMIGIMTAISGMMIGLSIAQKLAPTGLNPKATFFTMVSLLEVIGGMIVGLFASGGIMELAEGIFGDKAIQDVMNGAAQLFEGLGKVFNGFFKGLLGIKSDEEKLNEGMSNLEALGKFSEGFTLEKTTGIARIMSLITNLTKTSKSVNPKDFENFSTVVENVASGMLKFHWIVDGIGDLQGVGRLGSDRYNAFSEAADLMRHIFEAFEPLASFTTSGFGMFTAAMDQFIVFSSSEENVGAFVEGLNAMIDGLGELHDGSDINFDGLNIVQKLYDSIQSVFDNPSEDLPEFDATPIVTAILKAISESDAAITAGIHGLIQGGLDGLKTETTGYDTGDLGELTDLFSTLGNLSQPDFLNSDAFNFDTTQIEQNINQMIGSLNAEDWSLESLNLPVDFNVLGDVDEEGRPAILTQIETQLTEFQQKIDSGELDTNFEIKVRPVLDMSDFGTQMQQLRTYVRGTLPITANTTFGLGDQPININDASIITEIRSVKAELSTAALALQRVLYAVDSSLGSKINGVTSAVRGLKLNAPGMSLQDIDEGLYQAAMNSALTGVMTYNGNQFVSAELT